MINLHHKFIDGNALYNSFIAGSQQLIENQEDLNQINVFPVRDKDTGSNLASTMRAVIDSIQPDKSYKKTIQHIAEAALVGARGNSGVIFAQFLYGINSETEDQVSITFNDFAESVKRAIPYIYSAIADPLEGTMLTVIRDWSDFLSSKKDTQHDENHTMVDSLKVLEHSLSETTQKLAPLRKYGVVDAGAKGFVLFIKGVIGLIQSRTVPNLTVEHLESTLPNHATHAIETDSTFRYCTEATLKNRTQSSSEIKTVLKSFGDSIVVAGSDKLCRIHLHTDKPAQLFEKLTEVGTVTFQKVDDMVRQQQIATNRAWKIALVTDSTCDLPLDLIEKYQIHVLPIPLYFGETQYLDKVTITPDQFYKQLKINEQSPKSAQVNERAFTNLYSQLATHYDAIISVHLSSKFSGTYANSLKAAERIQTEFKKPIYTLDSKSLSGDLGLVVLKTAEAIEAGEPVERVVETAKISIENSSIFVSVKQLKHMIKGGRVSKPAGYFATLFGINPIVSMSSEGSSLLFGKSFGQQAGLRKILKHISKIGKEKTVWNYAILHASNPEGAEDFAKMAEISTGKKAAYSADISPIIGMHTGQGTIAISLMFNP